MLNPKGECSAPAIEPKGPVLVNEQIGQIVGGVEAIPNSWPWMVSLRNRRGRHYCGGSILNDRWIITTADCL